MGNDVMYTYERYKLVLCVLLVLSAEMTYHYQTPQEFEAICLKKELLYHLSTAGTSQILSSINNCSSAFTVEV